jgi:cysteine desulfurase
MKQFLSDHFGNPSSGHWAAAPAKAALEKARGQIAALLGCEDDERIHQRRKRGQQSRIEHPAITAPCRFLEHLGARITTCPWIDSDALILMT